VVSAIVSGCSDPPATGVPALLEDRPLSAFVAAMHFCGRRS
jgi:hypothetical protein